MTMRINYYTGKGIISTFAAVIVFVLVITPHFSPGVQARSAKEIDVSVTKVLQTSAGRMIFAKIER